MLGPITNRENSAVTSQEAALAQEFVVSQASVERNPQEGGVTVRFTDGSGQEGQLAMPQQEFDAYQSAFRKDRFASSGLEPEFLHIALQLFEKLETPDVNNSAPASDLKDPFPNDVQTVPTRSKSTVKTADPFAYQGPLNLDGIRAPHRRTRRRNVTPQNQVRRNNPDTSALQSTVVDLGFLDQDYRGKSNVDGRSGTRTRTAVRDMFQHGSNVDLYPDFLNTLSVSQRAQFPNNAAGLETNQRWPQAALKEFIASNTFQSAHDTTNACFDDGVNSCETATSVTRPQADKVERQTNDVQPAFSMSADEGFVFRELEPSVID